MAAIRRKCASRAPWKSTNSAVSSENCTGFQIASPEDLEDADRDDAGVEQFLHRVVMRQVVVPEVKAERRTQFGNHLRHAERQQHPPETAGRQPIRQIGQTVEDENPHPQEVPLQRALRLAAQRDLLGEVQPAEQDLVIVDLPAAADHDDHRQRVDPVHDANG